MELLLMLRGLPSIALGAVLPFAFGAALLVFILVESAAILVGLGLAIGELLDSLHLRGRRTDE